MIRLMNRPSESERPIEIVPEMTDLGEALRANSIWAHRTSENAATTTTVPIAPTGTASSPTAAGRG